MPANGPERTEDEGQDATHENNSDTSAGIRIISAIVEKIGDATGNKELVPAILQILFVYRVLPTSWKKKAWLIFEKIWNRRKVVISTDPERPKKVYAPYEAALENPTLRRFFESLPITDQWILLQGLAMRDLIRKGLHADSDEIKAMVETRYRGRGLTIVNMVTTNDIDYLLREMEGAERKECLTIFNDWVSKYPSISVLVSPFELKDPEKLKERIKLTAKNTPKKYILVNLSGRTEECLRLVSLIEGLKSKQELKYVNFVPDISTSGFYKSLRVIINFE